MKRKTVSGIMLTLLLLGMLTLASYIQLVKVERPREGEVGTTMLLSPLDECMHATNVNGEQHLCAVMEHVPPMPDPAGAAPKPVIGTLPSEFNWRDYGGGDWTTLAKSQGGCGSCWDFAALGALEAVINIGCGDPAYDLDLSEQYVLSCLPAAGDCDGGHSHRAFEYIKSEEAEGNYVNGVILESCFPYQADDTVPCSDKCPDWENQLIPISDFGYWYPNLPSDRDAIKTQLIEKGPLVTYMKATDDFKNWGSTHHNPDDYYPYPGPVAVINHAVVIVGYKDVPTIGNGGYWIIKNSWGTGFGYEGFYNVEYDSLRHGEFITYVECVFVSHELTVILEAPVYLEPGDSSLLEATVHNCGLNNESDVELFLMINGTTVGYEMIPELAKADSYTIDYSWTPMIDGVYNVTAYAPPVPGEDITANNIKSKSVHVQVLPDILIVDDNDGNMFYGTSLPDFESALTTASYDYMVWNESSMGNPPLGFLTKFKLIIWTCGDYWNWAIDPVDAVMLESYLAQGGNVLLEGEDIGYNHDADDFMINVAHAVYQVDNTGAPGLTVTHPTHPVINGLPSSFTWATPPPYADGVAPANIGMEVVQYTGTSWTAVTVFEGTLSKVVYYAFPLYCLDSPEQETLAINSVSWLLEPARARFSATPTSGLEPLTVSFTDLSSSYYGIVAWEWDFESDGIVDSTEQNPIHVYDQDGVYTVTLQVYDGDGNSDIETKINYITVMSAGPANPPELPPGPATPPQLPPGPANSSGLQLKPATLGNGELVRERERR